MNWSNITFSLLGHTYPMTLSAAALRLDQLPYYDLLWPLLLTNENM